MFVDVAGIFIQYINTLDLDEIEQLDNDLKDTIIIIIIIITIIIITIIIIIITIIIIIIIIINLFFVVVEIVTLPIN